MHTIFNTMRTFIVLLAIVLHPSLTAFLAIITLTTALQLAALSANLSSWIAI